MLKTAEIFHHTLAWVELIITINNITIIITELGPEVEMKELVLRPFKNLGFWIWCRDGLGGGAGEAEDRLSHIAYFNKYILLIQLLQHVT